MNKKLLMVLLLSPFVLCLGCKYSRISSNPSNTATVSSGEENSPISSTVENKLSSFSIGDRIGTINGANITVLMPLGTDLTNLVPNITVSNNLTIN